MPQQFLAHMEKKLDFYLTSYSKIYFWSLKSSMWMKNLKIFRIKYKEVSLCPQNSDYYFKQDTRYKKYKP